MTVTIALAGKGGTGKTTIAAMFVKYLLANSRGRVLAIDADPSANLNLALGLALEQTIGDIREEMLAQVNPMNGSINGSPGMNKYDYLDYQIEYALVEGERVDLLAMGRPEGPGCYCAVNHILRDIIDRMGRSYDYLVIDNEAGLEHLSRRYLIVNRVQGQLTPALQAAVDKVGLPLAGIIPSDPQVTQMDADGQALVELPDNAIVFRAVSAIAQVTLPVAVIANQ